MKLLLFAADFYLLGLGLTVAIVVYPSFHLVGSGQWTSFHDAEMRRMTVAVGPAWILQGVGTVWWLASRQHLGFALLHAVPALLAVLITITKAIPAHRRLERHSDSHDIQQLQRWHWLRTICWGLSAFIAVIAF